MSVIECKNIIKNSFMVPFEFYAEESTEQMLKHARIELLIAHSSLITEGKQITYEIQQKVFFVGASGHRYLEQEYKYAKEHILHKLYELELLWGVINLDQCKIGEFVPAISVPEKFRTSNEFIFVKHSSLHNYKYDLCFKPFTNGWWIRTA